MAERSEKRLIRALRLPSLASSDLAGLLLALAAAWVLAGFVAGELRPAQGVLKADFFPEERNAEFSYSFAQPEAALLVQGPPPPGSVLTMGVASPPPLPARELTVTAFETGELLRTQVGAQPRVLRLLLPPAGPGATGVGLRLGTPAAEAPGDERRLGLLYTEVAVTGPRPAIAWAAIGIALLAPALLGGALLATGIGALAAGAAALLLALLASLDPARAAVYALAGAVALLALGLAAPRRLAELGAKARGLRLAPAAWATAAVVLVYAWWIGGYALLNHSRFGTHTYDLGLYDQTFWLISQLKPNYSTGAGINMVGSHAALVLYPLAALYWLAPDPRLLLGAQALWTALGAVPLYLLGRDRGLPWLGVAAGAAYLLHPSVQNMALFDFHVDTLAATAFLFALWGADARRPRVTLTAAAVVILCKENFAIATACLGLLLIAMRQWRVGAAIALASGAWFLFATQVLVPALVAQDQSIHVGRFAKYGDSVPAILLTALTRPWLILGDLVTPATPGYLLILLLPFAFLPLLSPYALLALPTVALNLLSTMPLQQTVTYHYAALAVAALAAAALHGACWVTRAMGAGRPRTIAAWLFGAALLVAAVQAQGLAELRRHTIADAAGRGSPVPLYYAYLVSLVPPDAGVASSGPLHPHLTHRQQAYMFPNPFVEAEFFNPEAMPFAPRVDYIIYDTRRFDRIGASPELKQATLDELRASGRYVEVGRLAGIVLLRASE